MGYSRNSTSQNTNHQIRIGWSIESKEKSTRKNDQISSPCRRNDLLIVGDGSKIGYGTCALYTIEPCLMKLNPQTTVLTLETTAPDYWHPRASGSSQTFEPLGKDSDDKTLNQPVSFTLQEAWWKTGLWLKTARLIQIWSKSLITSNRGSTNSPPIPQHQPDPRQPRTPHLEFKHLLNRLPQGPVLQWHFHHSRNGLPASAKWIKMKE